ncbi:MAG: hypothetical protein KDD02_10060 [Phaeodactylibacter sp.]|nr:hypothetical protein [Phaeodactylibacter sp.]MCB9303760.1 hypothetical protein [Lewinellaceae bacterium]
MIHDNTPKGKSVSREEMLIRHQRQEWRAEGAEWNEFSRRAVNGLQYHPSGEPLEETFRRIEKKILFRKQRGRRFSFRQGLSIAAGVAILVLAAYIAYLRFPTNEKLFTQNFEYLPSAVNEEGGVRKAGIGLTGLRASAVKAYEAGAYSDAEALSRAYLENNPDDTEIQFYYGLLLLGKGDASGAIPYLVAVKQKPDPIAYERPATWYLALAYLKRGQSDTARRLFSELADGEDRYANQARSILKKL